MLRKSFSKLLQNTNLPDNTQEKTDADRDSMLRKLRQARSNEPLYKKHDDYLRGAGPVADKFEDRSQKDSMMHWKLGKYSAPQLQDPGSSHTNIDALSSAQNIAPTTSYESDTSSVLMSSQLKEQILNRYVASAEEQIAKREDLSLFYEMNQSHYVQDQIYEQYDVSEVDEDGTANPTATYTQSGDDLVINICEHESQELKSGQPVEQDVVPPQVEPSGWQGLIARRRRLMEQAIVLTTRSTFQSVTETADFEPYVVPEGDCLLPWGSEHLADERDTVLSVAHEGQMSIQIDESGAVSCEYGLPETEIVSPFAGTASENEFVDELDYIRYIFSDFAELSVLERIAQTDSTPSFVLAQLAFHPDIDVRCAVAQNRNTPMEALWLLCQDETETVRYLLADNSNIPLQVLQVLTKDVNEYIANRAHKTYDSVRTKVVSPRFGQSVLRKAASS